MSIQTNSYIIYGVKLKNQEADDLIPKNLENKSLDDIYEMYRDPHSEKVTEHNGFSVIIDGMNGSFVFFGKVLAKSLDSEPLETFEIVEPDDQVKKELEEEFIRILGDTFTESKLYHVTLYR